MRLRECLHADGAHRANYQQGNDCQSNKSVDFHGFISFSEFDAPCAVMIMITGEDEVLVK
jgi:hypothetical protein